MDKANESEDSENSENSFDVDELQEDTDKDDDFCFETDLPELRDNQDYKNLMDAMMKLFYLRADAIQKTEYLHTLVPPLKRDPDAFMEKLLDGKIPLPSETIPIPEVPKIDFSKYDIPKTDSKGEEIPIQQLINKFMKMEDASTETSEEKLKKKYIIRGREYDNSKPQTFNQLWTNEEQIRLEELLIKYPPERKESKRWVKIAAALGNRTPKQVCSRIQKYFLKLRKMGFAVPGRQPRSSLFKNKGRPMKKNFIDKDTTFFPKFETKANCTSTITTNDNRIVIKTASDTIANEKDSADWLTDSVKLEILEKIKSVREQKRRAVRHLNVFCWNCGESPIIDVRWTCPTCSLVDFCSDCMVEMVGGKVRFRAHAQSHRLQPIDTYESIRDPDYLPDNFCSNNYLDTNYNLL